ncbi:Retrovirus-related Pol polyprotein from transposon 17.6 [Anthophora retusa]
MGHSKFSSNEFVNFNIYGQNIKFNIVNDDFPIIEDGIFGLPALKQYNFKLTNNNLQLNNNIKTEETNKPNTFTNKDFYLDGKPTRVCFINLGESETKITNNIESNNSYDHLSTFKELIRLSHIKRSLREPLEKLLLFYIDVFNLEKEFLPCTNLAKHTITLKENKIINTKSYKPLECHKNEIARQMKEMLDKKIIEPSDSPYNSPVWVVPKKSDASGKQKWRIVIDFRKLNELTDQDAYPLPDIDDILSQLGNAKFLSVLDLSSGFHQIPMDENSKKYTSFSTPQGHYHYNRMPFGLKNAPATFQRMMDTALRGLINKHCFVCLDDIIIFGQSIEEHNRNLAIVLQRLKELGLKLQPDKCEFLKPELEYLGHVITAEGVKPNPKKLEAVKNFKLPKTPTDIKSFLGLAGYYRKFIRNFSKIAKPLTDLTKKDTPFRWTEKEQNSFDTLKEKLCSSPVLKFPNFNEQFVLTTDASNEGLGAILSQGKENTAADALSRVHVLTRQSLEDELIDRFRTWEESTEPPKVLKTVPNKKGFFQLGKERLGDYEGLGKWLMIINDILKDTNKIGIKNNEVSEQDKNTLRRMLLFFNDTVKEIEYAPNPIKELTEEEIREIIKENHDLVGHPGVQKTYSRIKIDHNIPDLFKRIQQYIETCDTCQRAKLTRIRPREEPCISDTPLNPNDKIAMDILGPLQRTKKGNQYILSIHDEMTKYLILVPLKTQQTESIWNGLLNHYIYIFSAPKKILTDRGQNFISELMQRYEEAFQIRHITTTAFHPQSNGSLERTHAVITDMIKSVQQNSKDEWDELLNFVSLAYNTMVEGQFALNGITQGSTIFFYVMSQLDNRYAQEVEDILTNPPSEGKYDTLKKELIRRLSTSQEQRIQQLLEHEEIGDRTPSQFLRHLRNLAGTAVPDEFLRTLWLNRLPTSMRAILATQTDTPLNKTAELADKINEVNPRGQHCATISSDSRIDLLCQQIAELSRQVVELKQGAATHNHSHRRPYRRRSNSRGRYHGRNRSKSPARSGYCWYHRVFGNRSTKCTTLCTYVQQQPENQ